MDCKARFGAERKKLMENQATKKSKRRLGVKTLVLTLTSVPMLIGCIVLAFFASLTMRAGIQDEVFDTLKGAATGALLALDNMDLDEFQLVGDDLYKGTYNVTQNMDGIDYYAQANDVEITLFYGDTRRATTITNENGERATGTKADSEVITSVLTNGEIYTTTDITINNETYYGYYMPINAGKTGEIIGMAFAGKPAAEVNSYIQTRINFIMLVALVMYIICMVIAVFVANRKFLRPIAKLQAVAQKLAIGDIDQEVHRESNDEFGDLTEDFADIIENIGGQAHVAEAVADGNLTVSCNPASDKDVMGKAIKKMVRDNNKNLTVIKDASARMASGANEVASASSSLAQGTTQQASAIEEITASIEEIANGAKINADDANKANELVQTTKEDAVRGNEQMKQMINAMHDINDSSENISKIMKVIDDIAFQTNILALNASVEAARAGVHGKGFAVVADEVRNLASKSADAAKDSAVMIEDSIKKVEIGSKLALDTAEALEEILASVENIADIVSHIASASANQASSVGQVNAGITQIADVVQTNSATSQECAAASAELSSLAGQLQHAVSKYKLLAGKGRRQDDDDDENVEDEGFVDNESIISLESDFGKY